MKEENSIVLFNEKNYPTWEFQLKMFVKDKIFWGHLDGSSKAPIDPKKIDSRESKNAYIIF
jgi:hypothetical protein